MALANESEYGRDEGRLALVSYREAIAEGQTDAMESLLAARKHAETYLDLIELADFDAVLAETGIDTL